MWLFIAGLLTGGAVGLVVYALLWRASNADDATGRG